MNIPHPASRIPHPAPGAKLRVIVVCGPTAVGKTAVGIELARALGGEIISADSMQVYRGMDIGTAKPTPGERATVPHHLIDLVDPDQPFDAAKYACFGREVLREVQQRGATPLIVGGTGLYIKSLLHGLFQADSGNPALRRRLKAEAEARGAAALYARLAACDPQTAARLHPNDTVRVQRALEVFEATGRSISELQNEHRFADAPFTALKLGLSIEREALYERINRRVDAMAAAGLEEEVRSLLARGYGPELKAMQSIGYSHMARFIAGSLTWEECLRTLKRDTRRFAKRQITWFRADPEIVWVAPNRLPELLQRSQEFLGLA